MERPRLGPARAPAARCPMLGLLFMLACGLTDEAPLPPDVQDPETAQTPAGAMERYRGTLNSIAPMFDSLLTTAGILSDELASLPAPTGTVNSTPYAALDSRENLSLVGSAYAQLHRLRGEAREARGFLQAFAPESSPALVGHLYAVEGYADIFLADLFCSGIPLSRVDFGADYTLATGSRTEDVYGHAVALFDSALALGGDSARIHSLAAIGRGRALLALDRVVEAAEAVAGVPDGYSYQVAYTPADAYGRTVRLFDVFTDVSGYVAVMGIPSVADREGTNGLDYLSSTDSRTAATAQPGTDPRGNTLYTPSKYLIPAHGSEIVLTLADAVEARLIEAEAALRAGDYAGWLAMLNHLRQTAWPTIVPAITGPLPDLTDPGSDGSSGDGLRVNLLFRERAFWLYLTAHRQGDLRRLVRNYHRPAEGVFPMGSHLGGHGTYRPDFIPPVPDAEQDHNPLYTGCFNRDP